MSVQVKEADANKSSQTESLEEISNESEQTYSDTGFSIASESGKSGKFTPTLTASNILNLQRTIGNQAVQRLIRSGSSHQCTASCNHVQRLLAPTTSKQSSQIQRHMDHDEDHEHEHEETGVQRHMGEEEA